MIIVIYLSNFVENRHVLVEVIIILSIFVADCYDQLRLITRSYGYLLGSLILSRFEISRVF